LLTEQHKTPIRDGIARFSIHKVNDADKIPKSLSEKNPMKNSASEPLIPGSASAIPGIENKNR